VEHQNVIELNGKRYDALTGALLGKSHAPVAQPVKTTGKVIDGFMKPEGARGTRVSQHGLAATKTLKTKTASPKVQKIQPATKIEAPKDAATQKHTHHPVAAHAKAHQPQKAKTLMRRTVHKPATSLKQAIKVQVVSEIAAKPASAITHKRSAYQLDVRRAEHAKQVAKHTSVSHFHSQHNPDTPGSHQATHHIAHTAVQTGVSHPEQHHATPVQHHRDIFEAAIAKANSHEQPAHHQPKSRSRRRRLANTMAVIGAFLVIGGFIGYLNMPNLELRVASFQAGFGAQMPGYTPTGFALRGGVERAGNTVSMQYQSGEHAYTITQQPSDWNSQTLVENTLALGGDHKTVQSGGRTIYIYDDHNAVWVDGNVRYDVTGNAPLSEKDIASLATSL
jgi:hypothetical protein